MDVYLVAEGCYSDYRVVAAFTDEALAERHADQRGFDAGVETWTVLTELPRKFIHRRLHTEVGVDGEIKEDRSYDHVQFDYEVDGDPNMKPAVRSHGPYNVGRPVWVYYVTTEGYDPAMATKAHRDAVAKVRAGILTEPSAPR